jgi:hypothetical protein
MTKPKYEEPSLGFKVTPKAHEFGRQSGVEFGLHVPHPGGTLPHPVVPSKEGLDKYPDWAVSKIALPKMNIVKSNFLIFYF